MEVVVIECFTDGWGLELERDPFGLPPFLPFKREDWALRSEVREPSSRMTWLIWFLVTTQNTLASEPLGSQ